MDNADWIKESLISRGIVDTHFHVGPEILPRKYNVKTLADAAAPHGATLVLKNHTYPTTPLAALARKEFGANFYGGIVLNNFVGGLNPEAIVSAVSGNKRDVESTEPEDVPIVVWMPTVHASSHLKTLGHVFDPRWSGCCSSCGHHDKDHTENAVYNHPVIAFDESLNPTKELLSTLEVIADYKCVLATGHLSAAEILQLVPIALKLGVPRIIVTHPHYPSVNLTDSQLAQLTHYPEVFIEHCFAIHTIEGVPLDQFVSAILATGTEQVLLSTDFGQVFSDPFPLGTLNYANLLWERLSEKVTKQEFIAMFTDNGRKALNTDALIETTTRFVS